MNYSTIVLFVLFGWAACSPPAASNEATAAASAEGMTVYQNHCSGCHGLNLEGNSATTLIKTDWQYGRSKNNFKRNITYGIAGVDMPAFKDMLQPRQIEAVAEYIVTSQTEAPNVVRKIPTQLSTTAYLLQVEQIASEGLVVPWAIEFINEYTALISERPGRVRWLVNGKLGDSITGLPIPHRASSTGGLMDIALDPDYTQNGWVYLAYSHTEGATNDKEAPALTKVIRGKIQNNQWTDPQTLFAADATLYPVKGNRWGCRFLFDNSGYLYFTIGDMAQAMDAQDLSKATGKVYRIYPDGSIPADNPFRDDPNALPAIFTMGNRNTQGLAQHPETGAIWSTDHGPMGGDELNILTQGSNYGWPIVTYGVDYSGEIVSELTEKEGMEPPIKQWTPSPGLSTATFCTSPLFPAWNNHLLIGALALEELKLLTLSGESVSQEEVIIKNLGRVRDVKFGPDGALYVVLNKPDVILRLSPKPESL